MSLPRLMQQLEDADQLAPTGKQCDCGSGLYSYRAYDGQDIFLAIGCKSCLPAILAKFRPEILKPYTQADIDEPI